MKDHPNRWSFFNKYLKKQMNFLKTFQEFIAEAKGKKPLFSKKEVMKILDQQGGIGGNAVEKYNKKNPNRGPKMYKLGDTN